VLILIIIIITINSSSSSSSSINSICVIRRVQINCSANPVIWHKISATIKAPLKAVLILSDQPFSQNCSTLLRSSNLLPPRLFCSVKISIDFNSKFPCYGETNVCPLVVNLFAEGKSQFLVRHNFCGVICHKNRIGPFRFCKNLQWEIWGFQRGVVKVFTFRDVTFL
jgi:hypothetical protein